jgi:hypothetical protein
MEAASLSTIARHFDFVRETLGPNRGYWVSVFQRFVNILPGDSWCAGFVSWVLDAAYMGKSPLPRTGATFVMLASCRAKGFVVDTPEVDDLYFFLNAEGLPHHVGIVTAVVPNSISGIAGNTSPDGKSTNGTGVFEHQISAEGTVFVRLPHAAI